MKDVKIIYTEEGLKNIKSNCPSCGSTDIVYNPKTNKLNCNYCRKTFEPKELNNIKDLNLLDKTIIGSGAKDITSNENIITVKCSSCGAEVVIDTSKTTYAKCHWCRNILSINNRIENGSVPDAILPFKVTKEEAIEEINKFVSERSKYALPKFKKEFKAEDVQGVYLPYLLADAKIKCSYEGRGVKELLTYKTEDGDIRCNKEIYDIQREFNLNIDDLSIESEKNSNNKNVIKTNNIINSIMPFDTNNCIKYESNYLIGYTSEKRNININEVSNEVEEMKKDIINSLVNDTANKYNKGIKWNKSEIHEEGSQWMAAYLPVWLYTYKEKVNGKEIVHFIALNGRTKKIMGSIPINNNKILREYLTLELSWILLTTLLYLFLDYYILILLLFMIPITWYYDSKIEKYRNAKARYNHKKDTRKIVNYKTNKDELYETIMGEIIDPNNKGFYE